MVGVIKVEHYYLRVGKSQFFLADALEFGFNAKKPISTNKTIMVLF